MIVFFGTRNYGKVDHVPGLFYVSTRFAYLQFIPLIPTETHLIFDGTESGEGFRGVKLGLSGKSIFYTYLRATCFLGGILAVIVGCIEVAQQPLTGALLIAGGLGAVLLFFLSYKLSRPSPQRALRLAEEAGIPPEDVAQFFVLAGLLPDDGHREGVAQRHDAHDR